MKKSKKTKLALGKDVVRDLGAGELSAVVGGDDADAPRETEPYSFCGLCEPYTRWPK